MGITLDIYKCDARKKSHEFYGEQYLDEYHICDIDSRLAWTLVSYLHYVKKIDISECVIDKKVEVEALLDFAKRVDSISMFDSIREIEKKMGFPEGLYSKYGVNELSEDFMYAKYEILRQFTQIWTEKFVIINAGW